MCDDFPWEIVSPRPAGTPRAVTVSRWFFGWGEGSIVTEHSRTRQSPFISPHCNFTADFKNEQETVSQSHLFDFTSAEQKVSVIENDAEKDPDYHEKLSDYNDDSKKEIIFVSYAQPQNEGDLSFSVVVFKMSQKRVQICSNILLKSGVDFQITDIIW